jgi:hypothetical protein
MRRTICWVAFAAALGLLGDVATNAWAQSSLRLTSYENTEPPANYVPDPPIQSYTPVPPYVPAANRSVQPMRMSNFRVAPAPMTPVAPVQAPSPTRPLPSNVRNVINYFGHQRAAQTLEQMPQRPGLARQMEPTVPSPQTGRQAYKPFIGASNGPTVSPYMNLYREEELDTAPNYYSFVRPQLDQLEQNDRQQQELTRLNRQVQRMSYGTSAAGTAPAGTPSTGHRVRFGDTAQFYGGFAR